MKQQVKKTNRKNAHLFGTIESSVLGIDNMDFIELYNQLQVDHDLNENSKYVYGEKGGLYEIKDSFYRDCDITSSQTDLKAAIDLMNPHRKLVAKIYPGGGYKPCFNNEIRAAEQLGMFCDYLEDTDDKTHIFIREYVEGDTLTDFIKAHPNLIDIDKVHIIMNILAAMDQLHKNNVLHCDLKTSNILIKDDYTVELFDFGAASVVQSFDQDNYPKYKYYVKYMPPELGRKGFKKAIEPRTDLFFLRYAMKKFNIKDLSDETRQIYQSISHDDPKDREDLLNIYHQFELIKESLKGKKH